MINRKLIIAIISFIIFSMLVIPSNAISFKHENTIYASEGIILDKIPIIELPHDLAYVYVGQSHFNLTLINFDFNYNLTYAEQKLSQEYARANITFTFHTLWVNISKSTFYISQLNTFFWTVAKQNYSNTDLVLVFTNFKAIQQNPTVGSMVIGCAYVELHVSYVFYGVPIKDRVYVAMHEIGHLLGLIHTHDPKDIMYPEYIGQEHFDKTSLTRLETLHS